LFIFTDSFTEFFHDAAFGFRAEHACIGECNVSQKIYTLRIFPYGNFVRMEFEPQGTGEEIFDGALHLCEMVGIVMDDNEIVGVAEIVLFFKGMFYKLIQFVQIDIGEELRSEIADRATALSLSLSLSGAAAAPEKLWIRFLNRKSIGSSFSRFSMIFRRISWSIDPKNFLTSHLSAKHVPWFLYVLFRKNRSRRTPRCVPLLHLQEYESAINVGSKIGLSAW